jgi:hypothetical protein
MMKNNVSSNPQREDAGAPAKPRYDEPVQPAAGDTVAEPRRAAGREEKPAKATPPQQDEVADLSAETITPEDAPYDVVRVVEGTEAEADGAIPDIERLYQEAKWNRDRKRFVSLAWELQSLPTPSADSTWFTVVANSVSGLPVPPAEPSLVLLAPDDTAKWQNALTVAEFAKSVHRAPSTIRLWIKQGKIEAKQVLTSGSKKRWIVPRSALGTD